MIAFIHNNWQWIVGVVLIPIIAALIGRKAGRKQKIGDIYGDGNQVINGDKKK